MENDLFFAGVSALTAASVYIGPISKIAALINKTAKVSSGNGRLTATDVLGLVPVIGGFASAIRNLGNAARKNTQIKELQTKLLEAKNLAENIKKEMDKVANEFSRLNCDENNIIYNV